MFFLPDEGPLIQAVFFYLILSSVVIAYKDIFPHLEFNIFLGENTEIINTFIGEYFA